MAKKSPTRTCIACNTAADKRELLRVVRSPEGDVSFDAGGKKPGRGAYLCYDEECFEKAASKRLLDSKLRVKLEPEDYERLRVEFGDVCANARQRSRDGE